MTSKSRRDDSVPPRRQRKVPRRGWKPIVIGASAAAVLLVVIALIWTAVHFSKSRRGDPRLIGTWQSDADATIMELQKARPVSDKQEVAMRELFGKMKVTYTDATITTELNGVVDTQPYQVVSRDGDSVVVKSWSALSKKDEQWRLRFIGSDTYWVDVEQFALSECFRRIK